MEERLNQLKYNLADQSVYVEVIDCESPNHQIESGKMEFKDNKALFKPKYSKRWFEYKISEIDEDLKGFTYFNGPLFFHFRKIGE